MQFYVFLDSDDNPVVRLKSYIDEYDPGFWTRNQGSPTTVQTVDNQDINSVRAILERFERQNTPTRIVREVCLGIGFDLDGYIASLAVKKPKKTP